VNLKQRKNQKPEDEKPNEFASIQAQLIKYYDEVDKLSKKKPDDAINKFKLGFINQTLKKANELLITEFHPFQDFREFDEDTMPSNSDVVLVLSQYISAFGRQAEHERKLALKRERGY
jgi:hypothetical protein